MNDSQLFMLVFMQNVLNFLVLYFFTIRYSRIVNDMNVHFEKTTQLFLDHLAEMYEYGTDYWRSYQDDEDSDYEEEECDEDQDSDYEEEECDEDQDSDYEEEECDEECDEETVDTGVGFTETNYSSSTSSCPEQEELFAQNCN